MTSGVFFILLWCQTHQAISPYQVETTATCLGGEHEHELPTGGVVELIHHLRSFLYRHGTVKPHVAIVSQVTEALKHVQGLGVIGDQHHLVR